MRYLIFSALLVILVFALGCEDSDTARTDIPASPQVTLPYRNTEFYTSIVVEFTYSPGDPNAASVARTTYENLIMAKLNELGKDDGNTFPASGAKAGPDTSIGVIMKVYTDGAAPPFTTWSLSANLVKTWHNDYIEEYKTGSYTNMAEAIGDLVSQVYRRLHSGWQR